MAVVYTQRAHICTLEKERLTLQMTLLQSLKKKKNKYTFVKRGKNCCPFPSFPFIIVCDVVFLFSKMQATVISRNRNAIYDCIMTGQIQEMQS